MQLTTYGKSNNLIKFVNAYLSYENQVITGKVLLGQFTDWPGGVVPSFDITGMSSDTVFASDKGVVVTVKKLAVVAQAGSGESADVTYNGTGYNIRHEFTSSIPTASFIASLGSGTKLLYVELRLRSAINTVTFRQIGFTDIATSQSPDEDVAIYQNVPPLSIVPTEDVDSGIVLKVMFAF